MKTIATLLFVMLITGCNNDRIAILEAKAKLQEQEIALLQQQNNNQECFKSLQYNDSMSLDITRLIILRMNNRQKWGW